MPVRMAVRPRLVDIERVYADHFRDVHRYLLGLTASPADADEIAAETFERALRAWDRVPEPALPWLLLTARRIATDRWRRARRLARLALGPSRPVRSDAGEAGTEFWLWFGAVARALTDRQREVLVLRYQRDLTDADIATIMGLSESGVRSLVARALEVLRHHPELLR
ncbi:MAG: sigma-70 family RNA polymerase sigma factor [Chloroflexi bacterium]|nr:sigma-70 family RNA polymerase sigma factor [Chloroflexota bacterium]